VIEISILVSLIVATFLWLAWTDFRRRAALTAKQRAQEDESTREETSIW
jgi:hypothetical protein